MSSERYLFLIKGSLVMAQPLAAPETGELLTSLLQQGFVVALAGVGQQCGAGARLLRGRCPAAGLRRCAGGRAL
jgi:hypothetical protein